MITVLLSRPLCPSVFSWIFGKIWNRHSERIVTDDESRQKFRLKSNHTLFWIPLQYWGIIYGILGIVILFQNSMVSAIVATVILLALLILEFVRSTPKAKKILSSPGFKSAKTKRLEQEKAQQTLAAQAAAEAERLKRQKRERRPQQIHAEITN